MENWIKKVNPGVIQDNANDGQKPLPPEIQQMIGNLQQELSTTQKFAQGLHEKIETKQPELDNNLKLKQMDLDFQREKLGMDNTTKLAIEELKAGIDVEMEAFRQELARLNQERAIQAQTQQAQDAMQHEATQADADRAAQVEQAQQKPLGGANA